MPLTLLLTVCQAALAGTDVWLDRDPSAVQTSGNAAVSVAAVSPDHTWSAADERAVAFVAEELKAARPLADVFDGELQIMLRLETALRDLTAMRAQDRELVYSALVFQGYAVHRYFQDKLATDPAAAAYRVTVGGQAEVAAWVDAIALNPDAAPDGTQIPEKSALLAFQELRARLLLTPVATVAASGLPGNGRLVVDGREVATDRARVPTGFHRVELVVDGVIRERQSFRLEPGAERSVVLPASADELRALATGLRGSPEAVSLSPAVQAALTPLDAPVQLVLMGGKAPVYYEVVGERATRVVSAPTEGEDAQTWALARASLGGGWFYDGNFFLENEGAPSSKPTVNAGAPVASVGIELRPVSILAVGAGADLSIPMGDYHNLPTGDTHLRLRAYPHLAVGVPWVQATAGLLLPWHLGVGARAHVPLGSWLELNGAYVYGLGLTLERDVGPEFEASAAQTGWVGIGAHFDAK